MVLLILRVVVRVIATKRGGRASMANRGHFTALGTLCIGTKVHLAGDPF
jgi:hypothetical protein